MGDPFKCGHWGGKRSDGNPCVAYVIKGTKRCPSHSGKPLLKAKAEGNVLLELKKWGIDGRDQLVDPGLTLLQLVAQSADRVRGYSQLLAEAYQIQAEEPAGDLDRLMKSSGRVAALIGYRYGVDREGNTFPIEEAIRGLVQLEMAERKFCGDLATKAIAAGLAERQVRMAEQQGTLLVSAIRAMMDELELTPGQQARVGEIVARRLREITGELGT